MLGFCNPTMDIRKFPIFYLIVIGGSNTLFFVIEPFFYLQDFEGLVSFLYVVVLSSRNRFFMILDHQDNYFFLKFKGKLIDLAMCNLSQLFQMRWPMIICFFLVWNQVLSVQVTTQWIRNNSAVTRRTSSKVLCCFSNFVPILSAIKNKYSESLFSHWANRW